ncbi:MAG: aminopeptidase [Vicingaceae bacterium]
MIKKLLLALGLGLCLFLAYHYKSVFYGLQQAKGQVEVLWNAEEISNLVKKPGFPDSTKIKFEYIQTVRAFAQKEIGLAESDNYTTFYDQKGKPILWVVTASPEFEIKAHEWQFPIVGSFSYKGFFDLDKAKAEAEELKQLGFDTEIDEVNAWSTLGWFRDPILSAMLERKEGRLAELIIHELTHATIYRKNEVAFNENLATLVGREGARRFLTHKYGKSSPQLKEYEKTLARKAVFKKWVWQSKQRLDSLYQSFNEPLNIAEKQILKEQLLDNCKKQLAKANYYTDSLKAVSRLENFNPNNAFFSGISTYHSEQDDFKQRLEEEFNGNLKAFVASFKD